MVPGNRDIFVMVVREGIDPGVDFAPSGSAVAVRDADKSAGFEGVQIALHRAGAGAVEVGKILVRRVAVAAVVGEGADLRVEELRAGRKIGGIADLRRNDGPVAALNGFDVSSPSFGDADADAKIRAGVAFRFFLDSAREKCYYDGVLIA